MKHQAPLTETFARDLMAGALPADDGGSLFVAASTMDPAVTQAYLSEYPEHQLEGRLAHYEREHLFENDPDVREDLKVEIERTQTELNRRKMYRRAEADRVFAL